jgi:hypothetical protein
VLELPGAALGVGLRGGCLLASGDLGEACGGLGVCDLLTAGCLCLLLGKGEGLAFSLQALVFGAAGRLVGEALLLTFVRLGGAAALVFSLLLLAGDAVGLGAALLGLAGGQLDRLGDAHAVLGGQAEDEELLGGGLAAPGAAVGAAELSDVDAAFPLEVEDGVPLADGPQSLAAPQDEGAGRVQEPAGGVGAFQVLVGGDVGDAADGVPCGFDGDDEEDGDGAVHADAEPVGPGGGGVEGDGGGGESPGGVAEEGEGDAPPGEEEVEGEEGDDAGVDGDGEGVGELPEALGLGEVGDGGVGADEAEGGDDEDGADDDRGEGLLGAGEGGLLGAGRPRRGGREGAVRGGRFGSWPAGVVFTGIWSSPVGRGGWMVRRRWAWAWPGMWWRAGWPRRGTRAARARRSGGRRTHTGLRRRFRCSRGSAS